MPIKPENRARYPMNWAAIARRIKHDRAKWRCECVGECGADHGGRCDEVHAQAGKRTRGKIVLTVAHLDHTPENCCDDNLRAMCQRCHLVYDKHHHAKNAAETRRIKSTPRAPLADNPKESPR